jgi:8-amino-7-oxononanoate synthase
MITNMANHKFAFIETALAKRQQNQQLRTLQPVRPIDAIRVERQGRTLINFSANDYLGLAKHPAVIAAAQTYAAQYGAGATASRLVAGTYEIHLALEAKLAQACGRETALLFNSGFQANLTILPALLDRQSLVLCDRFVHSSLLQGSLASGAQFERYRHNDLDDLATRLKAAASKNYSRILIVTETVFSMDGDQSDVGALTQLAAQYNAILYLDDAHALGVLGHNGMGLAAGFSGVDLVIGTFGKAFGAFGAFVGCSRQLRDYLVNCCPGFIYTTALPPAVIGAIDAALTLMPTLGPERDLLIQRATQLRSQLQALGYDTGASTTQIVPIILGAEAKTLALSSWLEQQGILATAIRPPTVAPSTSRIRLALSSCHTELHYNLLLNAIQSWQNSASGAASDLPPIG